MRQKEAERKDERSRITEKGRKEIKRPRVLNRIYVSEEKAFR